VDDFFSYSKARQIKEDMNKYALIGYPLKHSISPQIHNTAFSLLGIEAHYSKIEINPKRFDGTIDRLRKEGYSGFNVTIPHKQVLIPFLDEIDPDAQKIGAVNTVVIKNNMWKGFNTDVLGFLYPLEQLERPFRNCLVLGTGGASRAVIYAIGNYLKPQIISVAGRSPTKSSELAVKMKSLTGNTVIHNITLDDIQSDISEFDLIVNATPVGTFPHVSNSPLPHLLHLKKGTVVYDLVYNPLRTRLLQDAQKADIKTVTLNGLEMLLQQAAYAFELWTGQQMPVDDVRAYLNDKVLKAK
jgi:shikimate dehydrogenase